MFYSYLAHINKKYNLPPYQLKKLDKELTMVRENNVISPNYISRRTKLHVELVKEILIDLVFICPNITEEYVISCKNFDDPDLTHAYNFSTKKGLKEFILANKYTCPNCSSELSKDIRVLFKKIYTMPERAL